MRFSTIDGSGKILSQKNLREVVDLPRPPARLSCSRSGSMLALLRLGGERIEGREISTLTAPLYRMIPDSDPFLIDPAVRVIDWINADRTYRPVSPTTHFLISDSLIFFAPSDSSLVRVHDLQGRFIGAWTLDLPLRSPTDSHVRRSAEEIAAFFSNSAARESVVEQYLALPRPEHLPYHGGIRIDPVGRIWIIASIPGDPTTTLRAHTADGTFLGAVEIPTEFVVYEIGGDYILGGREDPVTFEPKVLLFGFDLSHR
jgi:hypothetical protein